MTDTHPTYDSLVDLALDEVQPHEAERLVMHLSLCRSCRRRYDEVTATTEQVLAASPRIEPPPGFDRRALTRMGVSDAAPPSRESRPRPRVRVLAAAVVAGVVLGVGGTLAWSALDDPPAQRPGSAVALDTSEGTQVGTVTPSFLGGEPVIVVQVSDGAKGRAYECVLVLDDGRERAVGSWVMDSPRATWVVPAPERGVASVRLVTDTGKVWSSADLG